MQMGRKRIVMLLLACALWIAPPAFAGPADEELQHRVLLVLSDDTAAYQETRDSFVHELLAIAGPAVPFDLEIITLGDDGFPEPPVRDFAPELVVPVGVDAARVVRQRFDDVPALNILITREGHEGIANRSSTALYLEQPFDRQFRLMRLTLPALRSAGVLLGPRSRHLAGELTQAARASDIDLHVVDISTARSIVDAFEEALDHGEVILAFPDADVLSPAQARWLLHMAWQREIPVFGFSQAIVEAGALAGLFTPPKHVGRDAAEQVVNMAVMRMNDPDRQWRLPPPRYPRYFEVAINHAVARALSIETDRRRDLALTLQTMEQSGRWQAGQ